MDLFLNSKVASERAYDHRCKRTPPYISSNTHMHGIYVEEEPKVNSPRSTLAPSINSDGHLSAVVCPLISAELPAALANLIIWEERYPPGDAFPENPQIAKPALVYSFNNAEDERIREQLKNTFELCPSVKQSFSELIVHFCDLPPEKDRYIRNPTGRAPLFGNKSGPNWQFYETMKFLRDKACFVQLMEVDCSPLRSGWLHLLAQACSHNSDAWIIGAHYSGASPLPWDIARHINGNALYQVQSDKFWAFIDDFLWPWMHRYISDNDPNLAYDCAWETFLNRDEMAYGGHYDWITSRNFLHRFRLTDVIVNIGGHAEQSGLYIWGRDEIMQRFSGAAIAHGPVADSVSHIRGEMAVGKVEMAGVAANGPNWLRFDPSASNHRYARSFWAPGQGFRSGSRVSINAALLSMRDTTALIEIHDQNGRLLQSEPILPGNIWEIPVMQLDLKNSHSLLILTLHHRRPLGSLEEASLVDIAVSVDKPDGELSIIHDFFR